MTNNMSSTELTKQEKDLIDFLMTFSFPYKDIIRQQIAESTFTRDYSPYFRLLYFHNENCSVCLPRHFFGAPVLLSFRTQSGIPMDIILHVSGQHVTELEIYNADSSEINLDDLYRGKLIFETIYEIERIKELFQSGMANKIRLSLDNGIPIGQDKTIITCSLWFTINETEHKIVLFECSKMDINCEELSGTPLMLSICGNEADGYEIHDEQRNISLKFLHIFLEHMMFDE